VDTIFSVTNADLERLGPTEAVRFVSHLLWAEARCIGLPVTKINISSRTDVADGGIDASVSAAGELPASVLISRPTLGFQIKTGALKPWQESVIRKELFGDAEKESKETLAAQVRQSLDAGGAYVLICTGVDLTSKQRDEAIGHIKKYLGQCGYADPKVDALSQNQLIAVLQHFPSLSLGLNGRDHTFQTHTSWAADAEMRVNFQSGPEQDAFLATLRDELRRNDGAVHVHVQGEAGVGKTRLVLEATRETDIAPLVVYCDRPSKILDGPLLAAILRNDNGFSVVLVVDECDPASRVQLWNVLKHRGARIKLVTIFNEPSEMSGTTLVLNSPPLAQEQIAAILSDYGVPKDQSRRWLDFCGGSARVAHAVGANLRSNPEDILRSPDTVNLWDRFVAGSDPLGSVDVQQRHVVLRYLALFRRFGYSQEVSAEAKAIAKLIETAEPAITWPRFQAIIKELRERRLLQGDTTLYITPLLLHIRLWKEWWDTYGSGADLQEFTASLPEQLAPWFNEMFAYAAASPVALQVAKQLLGPGGPFQTSSYLETARGSRLFLALTDAAPEAALECLKRVVGTRTRKELLRFQEGRRQVVWALERIVFWEGCFVEGAKLLLQLAEAETEGVSNNATGVFAGLFSPASGQMSPTEASPETRFPVLREALTSPSPERRRVAVKACRAALETYHFTRMVGPEYQGIRPEPRFWTPKIWGEVFDAYHRVWRLVVEQLETLRPGERTEACQVLFQTASGLTRYDALAAEVIDTLTELSKKPWLDRQRLVEIVEHALRYGHHVDATRLRWEGLKSGLSGPDFTSRLERYVGMTVIEDNFDENGTHVDVVTPIVEALAAEALADPGKLVPQLSWLVTDKASNGYPFGYALGKQDAALGLLPDLLNAQRPAGAAGGIYLLGGYLRALFDRDAAAWEQQLDALAADTVLQTLVPEITWRSGMTDRAAARILSMARNGIIGVNAFRMFGYGGVVASMSADALKEWMDFLLDTGSRRGATIALTMFFYFHKDSKVDLPRERALRVLTAAPLFAAHPEGTPDQMEEYYWTELAKRFVERYPDETLALAEPVIEGFAKEGSVVGGFRPKSHDVLTSIAQKHPEEVWKRVSACLGPPYDDRAFHLRNWLRDGAIAFMPDEALWRWVDEDVEARAWNAARFVPPVLERPSLARELLVRYGDRPDVRNNLHANAGTESFWGPASVHYEKKAEALRTFKAGESDPKVLRWVDEGLEALKERIRIERITEEREDL